ncbi:MFS transporter [Francisella sp. 19X1-34]|uniref:MFS transporter n=1 Tax=Francisella sp. 19X1-34 TaxID=3087177 RepID=UPI002E31091A|nr:MFS transporter [Francisella sp. 19X1-34]MED7788553.1 MFS transporter [Francisella sp. 19X1-34]
MSNKINNNNQIYFLLFIIFFSVVGTSMPYAIFAPLFINDHNLFTYSSQEMLNIGLGFTLAAYPLGQFIGAPIIGRFSDRYGRKQVLIKTLIFSAIGYFLSFIAIANANVILLILTRFITGAFEANYVVAQAFIVDITENKQKDLGKLSATASLAYVLGPIIGALLCNDHIVYWFNYATPFIFAAFVSIILMLLVKFKLSENTQKITSKKISLLQEFRIINNMSKVVNDNSIKILLFTSTFLSLSILTYYEFYPVILANNWKMNAMTIAILTAVYSISLSISVLYLPSFLSKRFSLKKSLYLMLSIMIIGYFLLISNNLYLVILQFALLGLAFGTANNLQLVMLSDIAPDDKQGEILGLRASLSMLGNAIVCVFGGFIIIFSVDFTALISVFFILLTIIGIIFLTEKRS